MCYRWLELNSGYGRATNIVIYTEVSIAIERLYSVSVRTAFAREEFARKANYLLVNVRNCGLVVLCASTIEM